jgi:hypothetical protein
MRFLFFLLFTLCALPCGAQSGVVTNVTRSISGYSGDGGPATAAGIGVAPYGLVLDRQGNLYVSVRSNHCIRKIDTSGTITRYAGTGTAGYSGDGGAATAAQLDNPYFMALDSADNLYVAEVEGSKVRRIDRNTGLITTVAGTGMRIERGNGGPATAASIRYAVAICFDQHQNMYISTGVCTIRKVSAASGIITNYAGDTTLPLAYSGDGGLASSAKFMFIMGICVDTGDNLLISGDTRLRSINLQTQIVTTIAGNDSALYNGEGLTATAANIGAWSVSCDRYNNIFLGDQVNHRLRMVNRASNTVHTLMGTGTRGSSIDGAQADTSKLNMATQIYVDPCGNIYFSDNNIISVVKKITYPYGNKAEVVIAAQGGNRLCYGMPVSFRAFAPLAGSSGRYQWRVNGTNTGPNSPTFTYTPTNGDVVDCILTSSLYCVVNPMDTSNAISMTVFSLSPVSLTISGTTLASVGDTVTLTAAIIGTGLGGYRISWLNRGVLQDTTTTATYRYVKGAGNDTITAILTSQSRNCYDSAYSNPHVVVRNTVGIAIPIKSSITLWPNPTGNVLHYSGLTHTGTLTVTDLAGRQLLSTTLPSPTGTADLTPLTPGHYLLHLTDTQTGERVVRKVEKR